MAYEYLLYEKRDRVATITINRPERLNALHPPANQEMRAVFEDFRDDPDVWVAILTGAGDRAFSAGNDLRYTAEHPEMFETLGDRAVFGGIVRDFE
ncbi:MAG TPA: enoyl-CoA hydratase-related protein, partial [Dehalococcoidia bacterium]|nr:enoyl-CoA hydratase-related protein [Dehalococcoidia bacterium]